MGSGEADHQETLGGLLDQICCVLLTIKINIMIMTSQIWGTLPATLFILAYGDASHVLRAGRA